MKQYNEHAHHIAITLEHCLSRVRLEFTLCKVKDLMKVVSLVKENSTKYVFYVAAAVPNPGNVSPWFLQAFVLPKE